MLKITEVTPEVFHLKFKDSDEMILHFIRFSEYYESGNPQLFRSKFSVQDALDSYKKYRGKSYFDGIDGFNIPVTMISKMAAVFGDNLNTKEKFLISLIDNIRAMSETTPKYIIATNGDEDDADEIKHELAHAFYYIDPVYRLKMDGLIKELPERVKKEVYDFLKREHYNQTVMDDEFQAYMATGFDDEEQEIFNGKLVNMFRSSFADVFMTALQNYGIKL